MNDGKLFCDICGAMIFRGICNCNRPDPPTIEDIESFSRQDLREILYSCSKDRRVHVKQIAKNWNHDQEATHNILWYLETKNRVAGGNYKPSDQVYTRVFDPNPDLDAQIDAVARYISENYTKSQTPRFKGVYYGMKSQGLVVSKKAVYIALNAHD